VKILKVLIIPVRFNKSNKKTNYPMKNKNLLSVASFLAIIFFSCSNRAIQQSGTILPVIDLPRAISDARVAMLSEIADSIYYVRLETSDSILISKPGQVYMDNERIIVEDYPSVSLLQFYSNGNYINSIGSKGRGPGELLDLRTYYVDRTNREIVVPSFTKIAFFYFDGKLNREILHKPSDHDLIVPLRNSLLYFFSFPDCFQFNSGYSFTLENRGGKTEKCIQMYIPKDADKLVGEVSGVFPASFHFHKNDSITYLDVFSDTIYNINTTSKKEVEFIPVFLLKNLSEKTDQHAIDYSAMSTEVWPDYFFPTRIVNTEKLLFISGDVKSDNYTIIYEKERQETYAFRRPLKTIRRVPMNGFVNDLDFGIPFLPEPGGSNGNELYMLIRPESLVRFNKTMERMASDSVHNNGIIPFTEKFKDYDLKENPVICVVRLKEKFSFSEK
jgi:hypothetical protein